MRDRDCVAFLQWALPRLGMRWPGFRKVRRQVCKRLARRLAELGLGDLEEYRRYLERHSGEWVMLGELCRVTISRFYRDKGAFEAIRRDLLPLLVEQAAKQHRPLRAWSAGCASGEEPYTLRLIFDLDVLLSHPASRLEILATDSDPAMLERARRACYQPATLRELPLGWADVAFERRESLLCLRDRHRRGVRFLRHDVRDAPPSGPFDLILCRNLAFTYFDAGTQEGVLRGLLSVLRPGGFLVVGKPERPPLHSELEEYLGKEGLWRKVASPPGGSP